MLGFPKNKRQNKRTRMRSVKLFLISMLLFLMTVFTEDTLAGNMRCQDVFSFNFITPLQLIHEHRFKTYRGLVDYSDFFPQSFLTKLRSLDGRDVWMDFGAGEGNALLQMRKMKRVDEFDLDIESPDSIARLTNYLDEVPIADRPRGIGITFKRNFPVETDDWETSSLRMKEGFFETMGFKEDEKFSLGTDLFGIFEYTSSLDIAISKALSLMSSDAKLFIYTGATSRGDKSSSSMERDFVTTLDGNKIQIRDWFRRISGDVKIDFEENENGLRKILVITRTGDGTVFIPELVPTIPEFIEGDHRTRSRRAFRETGELIEIDFDH